MKLSSINPHDQSVVGEIDISTETEITTAISSARKAFPGWKNTPIEKRIEFIKRYRVKIDQHKDELAKLTTLEMGKPLHQSQDDIPWELSYLDYYVENSAKNLADETVLQKGSENYRIIFDPYGVCVCIAPWNFPLSMFNSGVIPALIAGNTVVFKPSEYTTLSQKLAFDLLIETDLPEGVANIVYGAGDVGSKLVDQNVDLVWFTGSTKVGQEIFAKCGQKFIKCLAEMGGSSAGIVFADANMSVALDQIYWARFLNCGQVCSAVKRLFIEKPVYDAFLKKLVDKLKTLKIGDPSENSDIGPLVNKKQLAKLEEQVTDAITKGVKVEIGGKRPTNPALKNGNYFEPTIFTNVSFDMQVMNEEVFGPVLSVMPFETLEEVVNIANKTEYGLTNEIYTSDLEKFENIAKQLNSGVVSLNTDGYYKPECPIGGYKKSGIGREYGKIGMQEFAQVKLIAVNRV